MTLPSTLNPNNLVTVPEPDDRKTRELFRKMNSAIKTITKIYGDEYLFGVFCYSAEYKIEAIVIPKFDDICISEPPIDTMINDIKVVDIRTIYNATKKGFPEIIESLYTKFYIVAPRYEFLFHRLLLDKREEITAGIESGNPAPELGLALKGILFTAWSDNSKIINFFKQLTDAEKVALKGIINAAGDEGYFFQSKISVDTGVSRVTVTRLVQKLVLHGLAEVDYHGPNGTYIKILDGTLMNIGVDNNS